MRQCSRIRMAPRWRAVSVPSMKDSKRSTCREMTPFWWSGWARWVSPLSCWQRHWAPASSLESTFSRIAWRWRRTLGLADHVVKAGPGNVEEIRGLTGGYGVERAFDASGSDKRRLTAIQATRKWSASLASFKIQLSFLPMSAQGRLAAQPVLLLQSSPRRLLELVTRGTDARRLHETWPGHAHFP